MLRGRYEHAIDSKGRISIPARLRETLQQEYTADQLIITNYDACLVAFPLEEWESLERKVSALPQLNPEVKAFQRFFISGATECTLDRQGRVLLPPTLRQFAGITKDVVLVGMLRKLEIWAKESWAKQFTETQRNFDRISHAIGELGI